MYSANGHDALVATARGLSLCTPSQNQLGCTHVETGDGIMPDTGAKCGTCAMLLEGCVTGTPAAPETITVAALSKAADRKAAPIMRALNVFGADVTLNQPLDLALIGAALSHAGCALSTPTQADVHPQAMTSEERYERIGKPIAEALIALGASAQADAQAFPKCEHPRFYDNECVSCGIHWADAQASEGVKP